MAATPSIIEFVTERRFLGLALSPAQETLLRAIYGLPLTEEQLAIWRTCTEREIYPAEAFSEVTVVAGARAGKDSRIAVPILLYEAVFGGYEAQLGKGELGVIPLVAQDAHATSVAFGYVKQYVMESDLLSQMTTPKDVREAEIRLSNGIRIRCFACTAKSVRGFSIPAAVMDELAFFRVEAGAQADVEVQTAIRRGGIGFPQQRLVKISTPYAKDGLLFSDYTRYFGKPDPDVLVWRAPSLLMNPTLKASRLAREARVDAQRYAREYEALFSDDVEAFLPGPWIEAATEDGRHELEPRDGRHYIAAVDPSGGGADAFSLAIVHHEDGRIVQDVMKSWSSSRSEKVDLAGVCAEIAAVCQRYGLYRVIGDKYAGKWAPQTFQKAGVRYVESPIDKSHAYRELEPWLAQGRLVLLEHPTMLRELRLLEKRVKPGGKTPVIDHPRGGHDDCANALALAVAELAKSINPPAAAIGPPPSRMERSADGLAAATGETFWGGWRGQQRMFDRATREQALFGADR